MNYPTPEEFARAINTNSDSTELNILFSKIGITVQNLHDFRLEVPGQRLWSDDIAALQLEFKDIGLLTEIPYHDIDEGPWVLTDVIFWGWQKETGSYYTGPLPYELDFQLSRDLVRKELLPKLGKPSVFGFSENVDAWTLGTIELAIDYDGEKGIRCISLGLPVD